MACCLGLDLTCSERHPTAFAVLDKSGSLTEVGEFRLNEEMLQKIDSLGPCTVGIDAPLGLPRGLCCLEGNCACRQEDGSKGRACEHEVSRLGIGLFFTTKKSIIKGMVYRGITLKKVLEAKGHTVLEVYPYGAKVRLFGRPVPSKMRPDGLSFLRKHLAKLVPSSRQFVPTLTHDRCDAILAAHTAHLYPLGKTEPLGDRDEGQIVLPLTRAQPEG